MFKHFITSSILLFSSCICLNAQSSTISLSQGDKDVLMDIMVPALKGFLNSIDCTYKPGTTIEQVVQVNDGHLEIEGVVNYDSNNCGRVGTKYRIKFYKEGSTASTDICIYTPYCFLGSPYKYEWDCKGGPKTIWHKL